jgi:hypothetical protein
MERNDLDIVSINNEKKLYDSDGIKQALICGFFTKVVYKEGGWFTFYRKMVCDVVYEDSDVTDLNPWKYFSRKSLCAGI